MLWKGFSKLRKYCQSSITRIKNPYRTFINHKSKLQKKGNAYCPNIMCEIFLETYCPNISASSFKSSVITLLVRSIAPFPLKYKVTVSSKT